MCGACLCCFFFFFCFISLADAPIERNTYNAFLVNDSQSWNGDRVFQVQVHSAPQCYSYGVWVWNWNFYDVIVRCLQSSLVVYGGTNLGLRRTSWFFQYSVVSCNRPSDHLANYFFVTFGRRWLEIANWMRRQIVVETNQLRTLHERNNQIFLVCTLRSTMQWMSAKCISNIYLSNIRPQQTTGIVRYCRIDEFSVCIIHRSIFAVHRNRQWEMQSAARRKRRPRTFCLNLHMLWRKETSNTEWEMNIEHTHEKKCGRRDHKRCDNMHARPRT